MRAICNNIKAKILGAFAVFAVAICAALILAAPVSAKADGVSLESDGDAFSLTETEFGATERFVFTATVGFASERADGQAAGLVFGAIEGEHYWVFNIDRIANRVKLMYFASNGENIVATELLTDYYVGNDKMTAKEKALVEPKVKNIDKVQLKVVISPEDDGVHAEFFADNIKRFGVDNDIKLGELTELPEGVEYAGGYIGYNCFNSKVVFDGIYADESDYSYYSELYRQQYHFSQYAHWNNDPNGLVYYEGWYHLFYQHFPYTNYWSDMYWGHARSRDLLHWEHLPICLFPDRDWGEGDGYMWSGSALVYRKGMSADIDALNWYPDGNGTGLIAYYTRDGGKQDQMIMSSDDGGMTWTKRKLIAQSIATGTNNGPDGNYVKTDCRDPKVFPVKKEGGKVTLWGMVLTGMESYKVWFLKSSNMLDWTNAGSFSIAGAKSECPDIVTLSADDGSTHTVMTFTGRTYMVGDIEYDEASGNIRFKVNGDDVSTLDTLPLETMDYGPDSYATQTYYIDDSTSDYYGKTVSLSWFSGVPGAAASIDSGLLANARKTWNGGGFTVPVEWGLKKVSEGRYVLTEKPITVESTAFAALRTELYSATGVSVDAESQNPLAEVNSHLLEISATVTNPENAPVAIKINVGENEYTEIGWNTTDGYYVDRTHTANAGLSMSNYAVKYSSHVIGTAGEQSFYILSDNGGVEVFCDGYSVPFYVLTFASPYAVGAEFKASGAVTLDMTVNAIGSVWNNGASDPEKTILYVGSEEIALDKTLTPYKDVMAYSTSGAEIDWSVESGVGVVDIVKSPVGARLSALSNGAATILVTSGNAQKRITVNVESGSVDSDLQFAPSGKVAGDWLMTDDGIVGVQSAGDGYLLSSERGDDFVYVAQVGFTGAAAAVVFRASEDMSDYLIANYDNNGKIAKLWSPRGEIARANVDVSTSSLVFKIIADGADITVMINGTTVIEATLDEDEPTEGLFGLNVCAGRAEFKSVALVVSEYSYAGSGALAVRGEINQPIKELYNITLGNTLIPSALYTVDGRTLSISDDYFKKLGEAGNYRFKAVGMQTAYEFGVSISALPQLTFSDITIENGCNAVIEIGASTVSSVLVNGNAIASDRYSVRNGMLTVYASNFKRGDNTVSVPDLFDITVKVNSVPVKDVPVSDGGDNTGLIVGIVVPIAVVVLAGIAVAVMLILKKKGVLGSKSKSKSAENSDKTEAENNAEGTDGGND